MMICKLSGVLEKNRFFPFLNSMFSLSLRFTLKRLCLDLHIITNLLSRTVVDIITKLLKFVGIDAISK